MTPPTDSGDSASSRHAFAAGRVMVLGAATLWGLSATVARLAFRDHGVPPLTMVEMRLVIATAILLPWLALRGRATLRVDPADRSYILVLGVFGVAAVQGTYFWSISRLGVGPAILLQYLAPALIVVYEMARGRSAGPRTIVAVLSAIAGTALLVGGLDRTTFHPSWLDWTIGFLSAVTFAFYVGYSKRGLAKYEPTTLLFHTFLIAAACWAIVTPPWRIARAGYGADVWGLFLVIGIGSTLIPFALFTSGLKRLRPVEAAVLATIEPVVAITTAAVVLGEGLRAFQWLGAAFVIAATLLASAPAPREVAVAAERV